MARPADARRDTRATPRALVIAAGVLLAGRIVLGIVEKPVARPGADAASDQPLETDRVTWVVADRADSLAALHGKPILYDFAAAWCGPCREMAGEVFADSASAAFINASFVPARVMDRSVEDGRNTPYVTTLQERYRIKSFPTLVVARAGEKPVIMAGYSGKAETMRRLRSTLPAAPDTVLTPPEPSAPR